MNTQTPELDGRQLLLLTPRDCADLARVFSDTIYREVARGALPAKHVGRQLRIDPWLGREVQT